MKKKTLFPILAATVLLATLASCKDKNDLPAPSGNLPVVSQFVYDAMSLYYLWNSSMLDKKPSARDTDAEKYFKSILYKPVDKWSWITDDVEEQLRDFEGEATDAFGFSPQLLWADQGQTQLIAFVRYVYPNTPASEAGIVRGNVIEAIDGKKITKSNYQTLFGANREVVFTLLDQYYKNPKEVRITPRSFSTDPVLYSHIYETDGKRIGYLFYTGYNHNFNGRLFEVFNQFKQARVTDLVLDLRYNPGGDISAAIYLASLIAPKIHVENKAVFMTMEYNEGITKLFDKKGWDRRDRLGEYDLKTEKNPLRANLELNKVYILTTESSASASELTTFCLKPFMEVVQIGQKTSGKYTASWTIHAYDSFEKEGRPRAQPVYEASKLSSATKEKLKNWAIQPIVGRYTDKNGKDFVADGALIPNHPVESQELGTETWKPIGHEEDYLLAKALSLITGKPYKSAPLRSASSKRFVDSGLRSPAEEASRRGILLDSPGLTPDVVREALRDLPAPRQ